MIYAPVKGRYYIRLAGACFFWLVYLAVLIGGLVMLVSGNVWGLLLAGVAGGCILAERSNFSTPKEVALENNILTSINIFGIKHSVDLTQLMQAKTVAIGGIQARGVGDPDGLLVKLIGKNKQRAYIQLGLMPDNDRRQLWAAIAPYVLNPGVKISKNFVGKIGLLGVQDVYPVGKGPVNPTQTL